MTRAAVQVGAAWVRVAVDDPRPRLLAELPAGRTDLGSTLAGLFGGPVPELRVVDAAGRVPVVPGGLAEVVHAVPSAVAAVFADGGPPDEAVVVDVGRSGADVALVRAGRVVAARRAEVGGDVLDAVTARALAQAGTPGGHPEVEPAVRRTREVLSLLPAVGAPPAVLEADDLRAALSEPLAAVVEAVRAVLRTADRAPPVLLVGGVARTPLLAELLDAAGVTGVRVPPRPDVVAVVGALRVPPALLEPLVTASAAGSARAAPVGLLPPVVPARRRGLRVVLGAATAAGAAAGLLAVGAALPPPGPRPSAPAGDLVQYGYAVRLPAGWAHTGGLPERRRSLLTPVSAPDGSDLISVERTPLGYDADAEPQRARAELRTEYAAAVAAGAPFSGLDDGARFAGRPVVAYREEGGGEAGGVDWYVVLEGDAQLSVGCRSTRAGAESVAAACATVVGSLHRTG